jgi:hypothetical protein
MVPVETWVASAEIQMVVFVDNLVVSGESLVAFLVY